jgi:hypothetical protein
MAAFEWNSLGKPWKRFEGNCEALFASNSSTGQRNWLVCRDVGTPVRELPARGRAGLWLRHGNE